MNSDNIDIHHRKKRMLRMIERVEKDPTLIEDNRKEILRSKILAKKVLVQAKAI